MNRPSMGGLIVVLALLSSPALAGDKYAETIKVFKDASQSAAFFGNSYGYAVFPNIGKGESGSAARTARAASTSKPTTSATLR